MRDSGNRRDRTKSNTFQQSIWKRSRSDPPTGHCCCPHSSLPPKTVTHWDWSPSQSSLFEHASFPQGLHVAVAAQHSHVPPSALTQQGQGSVPLHWGTQL